MKHNLAGILGMTCVMCGDEHLNKIRSFSFMSSLITLNPIMPEAFTPKPCQEAYCTLIICLNGTVKGRASDQVPDATSSTWRSLRARLPFQPPKR